MTKKRKQASPKKDPRAQRIGNRASKITIGTLFFLGRKAGQLGKGIATGAVEAAEGFKEGYDEVRNNK